MDSCVDDMEVLVDVACEEGTTCDRGEAWLDEEDMEESGGVEEMGGTGTAVGGVCFMDDGTAAEASGTGPMLSGTAA